MTRDPVPWLIFGGLVVGLIAVASLAINRGANASLPIRKGQSGYWGDISSSVDWCEENYVHSHYVAEVHNSVTSVIITLVGLVGVGCCYRCRAEGRYYMLPSLLAVIGLGSVAFHTALRKWMQMLDEVPMLWLVVAMVYCVLEHDSKTHGGRVYGNWLPMTLLAWAAFISWVTMFMHGRLQVICFYLSFASAKLTSVYGIYRIYRDTRSQETRHLCQASFALLTASVVCWSVDGLLCSQLQNLPWNLPNPQLHAWGWHVLVAVAFYGLFVAGLWERLDLLGRNPRYVWVVRVWPVLSADPVKVAPASAPAANGNANGAAANGNGNVSVAANGNGIGAAANGNGNGAAAAVNGNGAAKKMQ